METQTATKPGGKMKGLDKQKINPFLWFNDNAEDVVNFYISIFKNGRINMVTHYGAEGEKVAGRKKGSVMTIAFAIEGQEFVAINGGPVFEITPAISFFVNCKTSQEIDELWNKLSVGGTVRMELDKYPFSEKYGWIQDKFGVSWQLILGERSQKITPCLMFAGKQFRKAEEAMRFYTTVFDKGIIQTGKSTILQLEHYKTGEGPEGAVVHAKFSLIGQEFTAMDSHMELPFEFNPAISFVVNCENQEEINYYWDKLSEGGDERAQQCGWLQDKFGLSWQIVPQGIGEILSSDNSDKSNRAMQALMQMKKIDIHAIRIAME